MTDNVGHPDECPIPHQSFLWMTRRAAAPEHTESLLTDWACSGYLVVSVTEDVASGGDPQFRQTRQSPAPLVPAAEYWRRHGALHERLRGSNLLHLPIGLGPDEGGPLALAWLVPAPARGTLQIGRGTHRQRVELTTGQRASWLAWLAGELLGQGSAGTARRVLVQPPGEPQQPARWHYGAYVGDVPVPGATCSERVRTLLAALPRYARDETTAGLVAEPDTAAAWPFLFNKNVGGSWEGMGRVNGHRELLASGQQRPGQTKLNDDWW